MSEQSMRFLDATQVASGLAYRPLVEALRTGFKDGCQMPVRHHHTMGVPGEADATLLLMPAWTEGGFVGVKVVGVFPDNTTRSLPAIHGSYLLMSGKTGQVLALLDGGELTARRTACASALAADYLAAPDACRLLVVGTGRLSAHLARAHAAVRPIREVVIWGRKLANAEAIAATLREEGFAASATDSLEKAVPEADIISCATLSTIPLVQGEWLRPGQHVDLVGAFTPAMRETDDEAVRRATVFVDTREGCTKEGGDIVQPLKSGALKIEDIAADLYELTRGTATGRTDSHQITLFKSVGCALEDLAAAALAYQNS